MTIAELVGHAGPPSALELSIGWAFIKDLDLELVTVTHGEAVVRVRGKRVPELVQALNAAKGRPGLG